MCSSDLPIPKDWDKKNFSASVFAFQRSTQYPDETMRIVNRDGQDYLEITDTKENIKSSKYSLLNKEKMYGNIGLGEIKKRLDVSKLTEGIYEVEPGFLKANTDLNKTNNSINTAPIVRRSEDVAFHLVRLEDLPDRPAPERVGHGDEHPMGAHGSATGVTENAVLHVSRDAAELIIRVRPVHELDRPLARIGGNDEGRARIEAAALHKRFG